MSTQIAILGYEPECHCDHCGRALQHGIIVSGLGVIGADCMNKMIKADRKRYSGTGKPGASYIRSLAKLKARDDAKLLDRMGYGPNQFIFELA